MAKIEERRLTMWCWMVFIGALVLSVVAGTVLVILGGLQHDDSMLEALRAGHAPVIEIVGMGLMLGSFILALIIRRIAVICAKRQRTL